MIADERTNRILMIGLDEDLGIVEDIISALDVEKEDLRMLRLYEIQNVGAEDVANKLRDLGIISVVPTSGARGRTQTSRGRISTTAPRPAQQRPGTPQQQQQQQTTDAASVEEILTGEPQVVIIESTNSLLVNATAEQHAQIALIIGYVDSETERAAIPYVVYPLENQDPTELAGILNQLITETTQTQDQEGKIVSSTTTKLLEEDIVIIPDAKTYSLIVYASRKNQQWIGKIISQLDQYRPQVLLDCTLVEIFKNDDFQLAIDWIQAFPDLTEVSGKAFDPASVVLPQTRDRFIEFDASGSAFYGDEHVNFLLTAIQTKNFGRVLANPKILVNDNESGTITTQETQYIVRLESQVLAGASTGTSTTRSSVNFESYQAGITLQIEPHISKGRQLRLQISMIRSDFRETGPAKVTDPETGQVREIEKPPDTVTNDIQTVVTVPDGHTVILGGLEKLNQNKGGSKVPLLGDIPLIGGLFRKTSNTDLQNRLYIFVKAHILRPDEETAGLSDIEIVSLRNRKKFEKYEKEMQEYQDWPGIKPKPMDPISVLEEDDVK
jgi:general secretion pathway protein D